MADAAIITDEPPNIAKFKAFSDVDFIEVAVHPKLPTKVPPRAPRAPVHVSGHVPTGNGSAVIRRIGAEMGLSAAEIDMLLWIANKESNIGSNPRAYDTSRKYLGLFQLGPHLGTVEQRLNDDWNTRRAIRYMVGRYGSVTKAYQFWRSNGWY